MKINYLTSFGNTLLHHENDSTLINLITEFSQRNIKRARAQELITNISETIFQKFYLNMYVQNILLIPILRAGIAMWTQANQFFEKPETLFLTCKKEKGTSNVSMSPLLKNDLSEKNIIVLDTIAATGDTLFHVASALSNPSLNVSSGIHIVTCFSSPEALARLKQISLIHTISIGCLMKAVDLEGYLIPNLGGDIGDKLFGQQYV